jgi:acyl carrier protein
VLPPRTQWSDVDLRTAEGRRIALVRRLEAAGASVHLAAVDLTDEAALAEYLATFDAEGWPRIRGVVHCAAAIEAALIDRAPVAALSRALGAKGLGALLLDRLLASQPLDFFVSFSSTASLLPQAGQGSYAASNAFLDAFASWQRSQGRAGLTINWGVWRGLGEAAGAVRQGIDELERQGIAAFDADQGCEAMATVFERGTDSAAVMPVDWARYRAARGAADLRFVGAMLEDASQTSATASVSFGDVLRAAPLEARREMLERHLRDILARVLRVPEARLDPVTPLGSLGLESLMTLELRNRLEASTGLKLSATLVWNHPTVRALATYLGGQMQCEIDVTEAAAPAACARTNGDEPRAGAADLDGLADLDRLADLSEDDALRALMGRS